MLTDILLGLTLAIVVLVGANLVNALDDMRLSQRRMERLLLEVWQEYDFDRYTDKDDK